MTQFRKDVVGDLSREAAPEGLAGFPGLRWTQGRVCCTERACRSRTCQQLSFSLDEEKANR